MGSKSGQSTTTVKNLPLYAEPFVKDYLLRASELSKTGLSKYTEPTYADQQQEEKDGINRLATRGKNGSPEIDKSIDYIENLLDGEYLTGARAEFTTMVSTISTNNTQSFLNDIKSRLGAKVLLMGDLSNENHSQDLVANTTTRYINRLNAELFKNNYDIERKHQTFGLDYGIPFASQDVKDAEVLRVAGLYAREYQQGSYIDLYSRFYENEALIVRSLDILGNAIRSMVGTQSSKTEPYYRPSPVGSIMGGAMAGAGIGATYGSYSGNPYAIGIGAAVGAIAGYASSR